MFRKKTIAVLMLVISIIFFFQFCEQQPSPLFQDPRGMGYAGDASCVSCHAGIVRSYALTAHRNTSAPASETNLSGIFSKDSNQYHYSDKLNVLMEKVNGEFFQTAYIDGQRQASFPFEVIIGSGRKAQTFIQWQDSNAYQLPVSYSFIGKCWANSPNYPTEQIRFDRIVPIGCFECHTSYVERTGSRVEKGYRVDQLTKSSVIYGIDCERCHGPAAAHVAYQQEHPADTSAQYIHSFRSISNTLQIESCATCHSGVHDPVRTPFLFRPGHQLKDFFRADSIVPPAHELDVHGNQYQLMLASKCFAGTAAVMTCTTCHDPHQTERKNVQLFSARCMECHQPKNKTFCSFADKAGPSIINNCIDCHMPATPSKLIALATEKQTGHIDNLVRSHLIGIYPEASFAFLKKMKRY